MVGKLNFFFIFFFLKNNDGANPTNRKSLHKSQVKADNLVQGYNKEIPYRNMNQL